MQQDIAIVGGGILLVGLLIIGAVLHRRALSKKNDEHAEDARAEKNAVRRDVIPYLIESYRAVVEKESPVVQNLIQARASARKAHTSLERKEAEQTIEKVLATFFEEEKEHPALARDLGWLEARTELQKGMQ